MNANHSYGQDRTDNTGIAQIPTNDVIDAGAFI